LYKSAVDKLKLSLYRTYFQLFFTQGRVTAVYVMNNSSDSISQHESLLLLLNDAFLTEKASNIL